MMMILFAEPANFLFDDGGQSQGVSNFVLRNTFLLRRGQEVCIYYWELIGVLVIQGEEDC